METRAPNVSAPSAEWLRVFQRKREALISVFPNQRQPLSTPPPPLSNATHEPVAKRRKRPLSLGFSLGRKLARLYDDALTELFRTLPPIEAPFVVAGVGGFGRGALALHSDLDLRILIDIPDRAQAYVDALLYPLWDAGVQVGHQVVSVSELIEAARDDLPTATALLDWRMLVGDDELARTLMRRAVSGVFSYSELPAWADRLEKELSERHQRFGASVYLLEPDVKNGAGGLRDLDVARWAAKARYGVGELEELVRVGVLVPREAKELGESRELLWSIRNLLHLNAGRRSDRLTFDQQELIAKALGYGAGGEAVERMMSAYYLAARNISRGLETIMSRSRPVLTQKRPKAEPIDEELTVFDGCITSPHLGRLGEDPDLAFRLLLAAIHHELPLLPYARDAIVRAANDPSFGELLRQSSEAADHFVTLCTTCKEAVLRRGTVMQELHDLGLLPAMIPEFSPVVGRVHHDVYHVYTVDVHSVAAVDRLAALVRGDLAQEYPLASQLAAQIARPRLLFFATLLHDVGKAIGGPDHSQRGAEMAYDILRRLGFEESDIDDASHLIMKHLSMYHTATRRDVDDPTTPEEFAGEVRSREGLRHLYLLTVADISTTSPTSMTGWKAAMLDQLFLATDRFLSGKPELSNGRRLERVLEAVDGLPAKSPEQQTQRRQFAQAFATSMPNRYLLASPPASVAAHAELARRHDVQDVSVGLVPSRHRDAAELCVIAADRPGLLRDIAAALAAARLEVLGAEVYSRERTDGGLQAVDLFWVRDRTEGETGVARAIPKLTRELFTVASGGQEPEALVPKVPTRVRPSPKVGTRVALEHRASERHTIIEVTARDRPGLLFAIADAFYRLGLSIAVAKINTEGTKAADVFYVSESDGSKISRGPRAQHVELEIVEALDRFESGRSEE